MKRKRALFISATSFFLILSLLKNGYAHELFELGGQVRLRGDFTRNQNLNDFSFSPGTHDEQLVSRTRLNLSLEPTEQIRVFLQGQFYNRLNRKDYSKVNLYQSYFEFSNGESSPFTVKLGRQELCYGSAFFLGANDFYDGLVWDGAKLNIAPTDALWVDLIGTRYVDLNKHKSKEKPALYGFYSGYKLTQDSDAHLYFFYHKGGFSFFHSDLSDSSNWFSLGSRLAGKIKGRFDYEIEPVYQFGKLNNPERDDNDKIRAYGGHLEAGYTLESKFKPRIFSGYAYGSGDNDTSDGTYKEFHGNVYNDNYIVGDTSLIADLSGITVGDARASGMHILVGGVSADINPKLNLNLDYHYFLADKTPQEISKRLGGEINLIFTYKLFRDINITASANRFFTGKFFNDAAGSRKDINYFYVQTQVAF